MKKDLENNILNKLLDKYEKSKLSKGGTAVNRSIKLNTKDDVLKSYTSFDSYKYSDDNDAVIRKLESQGFIIAEFDNETFKSLTLNISNINSIYEYLNRNKPSDELNEIRKILNQYNYNNFMDMFLEYVSSYIDEKYDFPKNYFSNADQLKLILRVFSKMFELTGEIKKRDFSAKYLGDSKIFETVQGRIIKIIKDFDGNEYTSDDDVLASYNIVKNSSYAMVKNRLIFKINNSILNLNDFKYELLLSDEMIESLVLINSEVSKIITVENLTSFYSINDVNSVIIYLAGFHNHTKQKLLLKIYEKYPMVDYFHFGDIDAGGFLIFNNLIEKTKIPFKPYKMSISELESNKTKLKGLTENDKKRLNKMLNDSRFNIFYNTIRYMLKNNVKLEQEILD